MSYIFYKDIIKELALDLQHKTVSHLMARDYADESVIEYVNSQNPFLIDVDGDNSSQRKKVTMNSLKDLGFIK
jgi:hypothetical protein